MKSLFLRIFLWFWLTLVLVGAAIENIGAEVRFRRPPSGEIRVLGDAGQLRSAIDNVIRNAVFFTGPDTAVEVEVERAADLARVGVADRGPGVPEEELARIFEVFYRIGDARDRGRGGAGLGLAIAARAVERHGGTMRADNRRGGGLVVEILLPAMTGS